jgi:hypothetical protein
MGHCIELRARADQYFSYSGRFCFDCFLAM